MDDRATPVPLVFGGRRRAAAVVVGTALLVLSLVACNTSAKPTHKLATATTTSPSPTPTLTPTPPPPPPVVWPLTGVPANGPVDRPALAVKIENSIDARPQTGLNAADMVWEEVVEGGITRYVAVYQSTLPPTIGPVRSIRPMDPGIAGPLHGLMVFAGGIPDFVNAASAAGLQLLTLGSPGMYRVGSRPAPHNLYATPQQLVDQADAAHRAAPPAQFLFAEGTPPAGGPGGTLRLTLSPISHPSWTWSAPDNAWLRTEGGTPAVQADGARLRATNVVVLRVDIVTTGFVDAAGTHVPATQMVGGGAALVAVNGQAIAGTWSKADTDAPVVLKGPDGADIRLAPGSTWIELVPNGSGAVATG